MLPKIGYMTQISSTFTIFFFKNILTFSKFQLSSFQSQFHSVHLLGYPLKFLNF